MAHHIEADYDESDNMFLPPLRTLGFNPKLTMNDSLLAQSYVEAYDLSYPEALRRIEDEVRELRQHLENEGSYELNDIGVLVLNEDGNLVFTPCEAGILTPSLYGLSSFSMKPLEATKPKAAVELPIQTAPQAATAEPQQAAEGAQPQEAEPSPLLPIAEEEEEQTIEIKMSWVRNAVAIAAAVVAFFLMTTPVSNSGNTGQNIGNLHNPVLAGMTPKDTNIEKINIKAPETALVATVDTPVVNIALADTLKPQTVKENTEVREGYTIVLASYITKKNAAAFVERLHQRGFSEAEVFVRNNVTRVVLGQFDTENNAYNKLRMLHGEKDFEEAWVLKVKDNS